MKSKLTHNLGLKIMAVLFSAVLWMIATGINNPVDSTNFYNIPVQLINTSEITSQNQIYKALNGTDQIKVTVEAPTNVLSSISRDNIVARADCSKITADNTVPIEVSLNDKSMERDIRSLTADKNTLQLEIETKASIQLSIEVVKTGKVPEGYTTGKVTTETNTMNISGPESALEPVKRAVVEVSLNGVTADIDLEAQIRLLDADGKEINNSNIKKSIDSVKVNVPILNTKEVVLDCGTTGTPADGYLLTDSGSCDPQTILIAGRESVLKEIEKIEIPAEELDVEGARENVSYIIDIRKYLPAGVSLVDESTKGSVTLTAQVEPIRRRTISIAESSIQRVNVPEGWQAEIVPDQNIKLVLSGLQNNLNAVDEAALIPHVDIATIMDESGSIPAGEREIVVNFIIPDSVQQEGTVKAIVRLTKKAEE